MERANLHSEGTTLQLDPNSRMPLYRQLRDVLRRRILDRSLPPGAKLPSTRALAKNLALSRNTVVNAYEALSAEGLVTGAIGSGTRVTATVRRRRLDVRSILRESHFPTDPTPVCDPDGNPLYMHR
ncbi:MAG: winged helix-turn-helix domain-containing protein [Bryobacteraceae bacterium]|jgi:DNA-binding transcriptional regulator YhcF (GntR family)